MINIKDAASLAKRVINRIVISITNCYQTAGGQGLLFIHRSICHQAVYKYALQTANFTKIISCKHTKDDRQRCVREFRCKTPRKRQFATPEKLMYSSWAASQIDKLIVKLKYRVWLRSPVYHTNSFLSQPLKFCHSSLP